VATTSDQPDALSEAVDPTKIPGVDMGDIERSLVGNESATTPTDSSGADATLPKVQSDVTGWSTSKVRMPGGKKQAKIWASRGVWLGGLAVAIAGTGQWLLPREDLRLVGVGLLVLGMALAALAWSGLREIPLPNVQRQRKALVAWRRSLILRLAGIVASVLLLVGSLAAFQARPNDFFGLQGALWLASMGLLMLSCARWHSNGDELAIPWSRIEIAVFAAIIALSLVTRLVWLDQIPWRVEGNEFTAFRESMNFYSNPPTIPLFTTVFLNTGMPSMWFWPEGLIMRVMGANLGGARYWPALVGALVGHAANKLPFRVE
jgi:hypothetical protein